ncbi:MAG: Trm112 family protein [Bradyrhizobium sp.]|nr:MAG: Trm112 family protein [Bradyrhizobium sp.]
MTNESNPSVPVTSEGAERRAPARAEPKMLEILVCPLTRGTLSYDAEKQELISRAAKLAYPIRDGVPIMLPEEARRLED